MALTLGAIVAEATGDFDEWVRDRKNRRVIPHRHGISGTKGRDKRRALRSRGYSLATCRDNPDRLPA